MIARPPAAPPQRVLVWGGTSEIGTAIVDELATRGGAGEVVLAGRDPDGLHRAAQRLRDRGGSRVETVAVEARERNGHRTALAQGMELLGGIDLAILAVGVLGERGGLPADIDAAVDVLDVNVLGAGSLLLHSVCALREQGHGTVVVLSSLAAERARASNAVYCASKAGLDALAVGIGDALVSTGVRVMVVRPGFVVTRMTAGLRKPPLSTSPESVARATARGLERGAPVVWAPGITRWVMAVLKLLPHGVFRRLPL